MQACVPARAKAGLLALRSRELHLNEAPTLTILGLPPPYHRAQDSIHAAFRQRNRAQDELLAEQAALDALVQAAAAALEQHAAFVAGGGEPAAAIDGALGGSSAEAAALDGAFAFPQPLSAEQLASLATPAGTAGRELPRRGHLLDASAEAEALEQLLEDGWLGRGAAVAAARALDKGEQAVSSKEGAEEAAGEEVAESCGPSLY